MTNSKLPPLDASRRKFLQMTAAGLAGSMLGSAASAADWPNKTIRFISQSGAGDAVDGRLRDFVNELAPVLNNTSCIVENKPGAGGIIAAQSLLNAEADGNTVDRKSVV